METTHLDIRQRLSLEGSTISLPRDDSMAGNEEGSATTTIGEDASGAVDGGGESKAPSDEDGELADATLDRDELFHLLKSERRRRALRYLLAADEETVVMRDVAEAVAAEEYDTTVARLGSEERQRVYITLYQSHLPQLAKAGVITYDQRRGHVTSTPLIEAFEAYLSDSSPEDLDSERRGWMALAGFGVGALLTLALVPALGAVVTLGVILLVMAAGVTIEFATSTGSGTASS